MNAIMDGGRQNTAIIRLAIVAAIAIALVAGMAAHVVPAGQAFAASDSQKSQMPEVTRVGTAAGAKANAGAVSSTKTVITASVAKSRVAKKKMSMTMAGGDVTNIKTTAAGAKVKWATTNKAVATVKSTGKYTAAVTALKPGACTITAKTAKQAITCQVTVTGKLNKKALSLTPLQTSTLSLKTYKNVKVKSWTSSNEKCAKVSSSGVITPVANGNATITCTDKKGYKYRCSVKVTRPAITCSLTDGGIRFLGGKLYRYRNLALTNKSGKTIVLDTDAIRCYPSLFGTNLIASNLTGCDLNTGDNLSQKPISVTHGSTCTFAAKSELGLLFSNDGQFALSFAVGANRYAARFTNSGTLLAITRI